MKTDSPTHRSVRSQLLPGMLVIGVGLLFLLDNFDIIDFHHAIAFWPVLFILIGVVKLLDTTTSHGYLAGLVWIGIGVMLTLNRLGFVYLSIHTLWPLILIAVGALMLFRAGTGRALLPSRRRRRRAATGIALDKPGDAASDAASNAASSDASDDVLDLTVLLGGLERRVSSKTFRGGEVSTIMGGCSLDMRGASIEGEAVLNVFAVFGGIQIKCPPDWTISLQGTPIMGGFDEQTIVPPDTSKRLVIKGYVIMGGLEVRN